MGDCILISNITDAVPYSNTKFEGVVLDRRQRYIDVCMSSTDAARMNTTTQYRFDCTVNEVNHRRMVESLEQFSIVLDPPMSRVLRDLMLYSYPNSMIRLSANPGGLRMGLPDVMVPDPSPASVSGVGSNINPHDATSADDQTTFCPCGMATPSKVPDTTLPPMGPVEVALALGALRSQQQQ